MKSPQKKCTEGGGLRSLRTGVKYWHEAGGGVKEWPLRKKKQENQEVWKFQIKVFWIIGARIFEIRSWFQNSLDYENLVHNRLGLLAKQLGQNVETDLVYRYICLFYYLI